MLLIILIALVWLIVLQVTVNRLQDQIDSLSALLPGKSDRISSQKETPSPQNPPISPAAHFEMHEIKEEPVPAKTLPAAIKPSKPSKPAFEITAAKLFSWLGGFMLFLGCVFGIKYVVENNLLSPALRILLSTGLGLVLAISGYIIKNPKYRVLCHTLLGSGLAIIYAAVFCAHSFYHFIALPVAFLLMAVTSFIALGTALQKDAKYVGYLGTVIAFLTPVLLRNGADAWVIFFLYVFCINAAAAYAAVQKHWHGLFICALSFTWLSQAAWLFPLANYKFLGVITFFSLYALASAWLIRRHQAQRLISYATGSFLCMGLLLMLPVGAWLSAPIVSILPATISVCLEFLGYVLLVNALILLLAGRGYLPPLFARIAKMLSFLILCTWMFHQADYLPLWLTLGACMLFTALNSSVELFSCRQTRQPDKLAVLYPVASMGSLVLFSFLPHAAAALDFISIFGVLGLLLAGTLMLAVLAHMLWASFVAIGLLFVFLLISLCLGTGGYGFTPFILLSGLIPLFLCTGVFFLLRRSKYVANISLQEKAISAVTALTPFVLILTVLAQLSRPISFHWILATAWVVCVLTALAARLYKNTFTLPAAAVGAGLVQLAVWGRLAIEQQACLGILAGWSLALFALFIILPFLSKEHFWDKNGSWIACAVSGLTTCWIGCLLVCKYCACISVGVVPAVLLGIYALLLRRLWGPTVAPQGQPVSIGVMSAATLFFLTLIFPLQIHNYWLATAWAAEAVFLACLHKQLPYKGWKIVSAGLLCMVSGWLLLGNDFKPVPTTHIWNWYLWIYGLCAGALLATALLWEKPSRWRNAFYILFGCTLFWLLNIEIAQWFYIAGSYLDFEFIGEVTQALTYTLAWALFGVCTIGIGLRLQKPTVSKTGIGVMGLALAKFFLSDIWQLQAIYRILGLFGLAVMLIIASFWYQKKQKVS